jgi:hypothetical protein
MGTLGKKGSEGHRTHSRRNTARLWLPVESVLSQSPLRQEPAFLASQ